MAGQRNASGVSSEEFVKNLTDSGLFSGDDLRNALEGLSVHGTDGGILAQQLVNAGKLTQHQAEAILTKRFDELRIGNYDILARLGAGGMGTVYKARHRRMRRIVALKVMASSSSRPASFGPRFQREVETIAQLTHPNIVMAYDADEAEVGDFLVMEYVAGRDLASEVEENGPFAVAEAVWAILQAARGLEYAHARGIVHRDIKPANLLRDLEGTIKVADLGLARLARAPGEAKFNSSLTQAGGIVGTTDYMSPEQALDSTTVDQRTDIYSLGCTLFFLLTGRPLYRSESMLGLLVKHREAPIPSLPALRPTCSSELDTVFHKMVAKRPEDRYATMTEVVAALEELKGLPEQNELTPPAHAARQQSTMHGDISPKTSVTRKSTAPDPENAPTVAVGSWEELKTRSSSKPGVSAPAISLATLTVVLVEPSRTQAAIIRSYLQQLGIQNIHSANSGQQAVEMARANKAHAVLSSMHLSDMTGTQLAEALRADPALVDVGVVLATSESGSTHDPTQSIVSDSLRLTKTIVMPKPFDMRRLGESLALALGRPINEFLP